MILDKLLIQRYRRERKCKRKPLGLSFAYIQELIHEKSLCANKAHRLKFLFVIEAVVILIERLTCNAHVKALENIVVNTGKNNGGVYITAAECIELLHGLHRIFIGSRTDRKRNEHFVRVQARVAALHVVGFQCLNRTDNFR